MAKRRSSKASNEAKVALGLGLVIAIFLFGGQITGNATAFNTSMDVVISSLEACTISGAPTSISVTGGSAETNASSTLTMTNTGNADATFKQNANRTVNTLFSDGTTVSFIAIASSGSASLTSDTAMTTAVTAWCTTAVNGENCTARFDVIATAAEEAATYEFDYELKCHF